MMQKMQEKFLLADQVSKALLDKRRNHWFRGINFAGKGYVYIEK